MAEEAEHAVKGVEPIPSSASLVVQDLEASRSLIP